MDELNSPFGLDFDNTQKLVLASSELFRLSRDLRQCHDGLDRAISKRVNRETKRRQYDDMKVTQNDTVCLHGPLKVVLPGRPSAYRVSVAPV